jgi:hypothetical protein
MPEKQALVTPLSTVALPVVFFEAAAMMRVY